MTIKISNRIVDYRVVPQAEIGSALSTQDSADKQAGDSVELLKPSVNGAVPIPMIEQLTRPATLQGVTYKIKNHLSEHALYVTITDIGINPGSPYYRQRPYEIFINSKNMDHFQWIVALTRIISAVFRKGGDSSFLVEELRAVFDPRGGYFKPGTGEFIPSLVAEIGSVIEEHMRKIGMIKDEPRPAHVQQILDEKRAEYEQKIVNTNGSAEDSFPPGSQLCRVCNVSAVIMMDGCLTCLNCGDSKCS